MMFWFQASFAFKRNVYRYNKAGEMALLLASKHGHIPAMVGLATFHRVILQSKHQMMTGERPVHPI
jgi:hypothetical protein